MARGCARLPLWYNGAEARSSIILHNGEFMAILLGFGIVVGMISSIDTISNNKILNT